MRKSLIAVIAALSLVALSAVAYAQYKPPSHTMKATVKPNTKGKSVTADVTLNTAPTDQSTVSNFTYQFPKELKLDPRGFPFCTANKLEKAGFTDSACPKGSKVGSGTAQAFVGNRQSKPINFNVTVYAGTKTSLTIRLIGQGDFSTIKRAFPAKIKKASGNFKQSLSTNIPQDVQFVGGTTPVVLAQVRIKVGGKRGKSALIRSISCPKNKTWTLGTRLTYSRPAGATSQANASVKCK